jgi:hypothetical protein
MSWDFGAGQTFMEFRGFISNDAKFNDRSELLEKRAEGFFIEVLGNLPRDEMTVRKGRVVLGR